MLILSRRGVFATHLFIPVMLNLFQHLASLLFNLFADKILKQVQDDITKNPCNERFNHLTI